MHVGALVGWLRDRADRRAAGRVLFSPACGYAALGPEGAWCWLLEQARTYSGHRADIERT